MPPPGMPPVFTFWSGRSPLKPVTPPPPIITMPPPPPPPETSDRRYLSGQLEQDLDVGVHLHGLHVALQRRLDAEGLQRVQFLVADGLAREREDFGGLARFLRDEGDGLGEGDGRGREERARNSM